LRGMFEGNINTMSKNVPNVYEEIANFVVEKTFSTWILQRHHLLNYWMSLVKKFLEMRRLQIQIIYIFS